MFGPPPSRRGRHRAESPTLHPPTRTPQPSRATVEKAEGKTDENPVNIGWDSHVPIDAAPETLVRGVEGNESMRRR